MENLGSQTGLSTAKYNLFGGQTSLPPKGPNKNTTLSQPPPQFWIPNQNQGQERIPRPSPATIPAEEQPPWLEDLLNEPETPVTAGHRRSSSEDLWRRNLAEGPTWGYASSGCFNASGQAPSSAETSTASFSSGITAPEGDAIGRASRMQVSSTSQDVNVVPLTAANVHGQAHSEEADNAESSSRARKASQAKPPAPDSASKVESKRPKQHNGRRSQMMKLQYIAELERNVHALQAEGSQVSAELEFVDQHNLILSMENRALKQRLESLSQVQLIKSMEQEILERELVRLQYVYHQQNLHLQYFNQHQPRLQQRHPMHRRGRSCDIDSQFGNLNLNPHEPGSSRESFTVPHHR